MSEPVHGSGERHSMNLRSAFPEVCKWFDAETGKPPSDDAALEVEKRARRFHASGSSPCEQCPLCPGHEDG